jgi:hypothetical protein
MNNFDRMLALCIGEAATKRGHIDREIVSLCYYEVLTSTASTELHQVSEKWIDFLAEKLSGVKVVGRNSEQAAHVIFREIAKL